MFKKIIVIACICALVLSMTGCGLTGTAAEGNVVNVYSSRHYDSDRELFQLFEEQTGIRVNVLEGNSQELQERVRRERNNPQADLLIDVGVTTLYSYLEESLLAPHEVTNINEVESGMSGERWLALTNRARAVVYDHEVTSDIELHSYLDLASPDFAGEILVRSSTNIYNIALIAGLIQAYGEQATQTFVEGIVANMAREPQGNDRDQAIAMVDGQGTLAVMSTYYIQMLKNSSDTTQQFVGPRLSIAFPDEVFVDISWMGLIDNATNAENAMKLMEFLISHEAQTRFMLENGEMPININVPILEELSALYDFQRMNTDYETLGRYMGTAIKMMNEAGWR